MATNEEPRYDSSEEDQTTSDEEEEDWIDHSGPPSDSQNTEGEIDQDEEDIAERIMEEAFTVPLEAGEQVTHGRCDRKSAVTSGLG
jgi:hypothetical protein